ncbi:sulfatase-like hydrolase/transferase [Paracoccus zhejiangensis]|uniref:Sulfatase n=1 Tax=Paracoccus zhejiangensis TaxID=1077935 RepID=A0A2H5F0E6_9RHOB|nr:sulfatase-like hydrolase/transferase [Paracoccus zhejiangensis]AUH65016.1 sulfatase [Paracoccus zhejiangensis]
MRRPALWQAGMAALALWLVMILPAAGGAITPARLMTPELPLILLLLIASGPNRVLRALVSMLLLLIAALKLADLAMAEILGRGFNPIADLALIDASARMIAGSFGIWAAIGAGALCLMLAAGLAAMLWCAAGVWQRVSVPRLPALLAAVGLVALLIPGLLPLRAATASYAMDKTALALRSLTDLREFRRLAEQDPMAAEGGLLTGIDRDVLVIFIESYGRTSFDTPFYAEAHLPTLRAADETLADAGLAMRSGFLTAPTQGGQSWLSHATFTSGLWIDDQSRYQAALASGRQGLFHLARKAGFHTAAVMPAITRPWPESTRMGFDRVLGAGDLGYRGKPFNWVTMPDQFTLAATDRLLRNGNDDRLLFAQVALISSHAPWVPIPQMLDWDQLGDGRVFDAMAEAGPTPKELWDDYDDVRLHYRGAITYALQAVAGYARLHAADPPLLIVLGDHQAAARIALDERREVPIHLIGPRDLVERSRDWGFAPGLIPPPGSPALPMQDMRDLILQGFGPDSTTAALDD